MEKNANDSARQVYRYIRLTYLMNDLLNAVDRDVIGLQVGVELCNSLDQFQAEAF